MAALFCIFFIIPYKEYEKEIKNRILCKLYVINLILLCTILQDFKSDTNTQYIKNICHSAIYFFPCKHKMSCFTTKPTKWPLHVEKTQISTASTQSDQSLCSPHKETLGPHLPSESDQTGHTPRLIGVLTGRKDHFVGFVMRWLKSHFKINHHNNFMLLLLTGNDVYVVPYEPPQDKTNKMTCAPNEDSDQPGHLPSLIRVIAVPMKKAWVLSNPFSTQRGLWCPGWSESLLGAQSFCWFCHEAAHIWKYMSHIR